jgi:hypothetical protein
MIKKIFSIILPGFIFKPILRVSKIFFIRNAYNIKTLKKFRNKSKSIVLGNGPSLKNDIPIINEINADYDFICVNNFCSASEYITYRPCFYLFLDSYFFSKKAHRDWIVQREKTFHIINEKTTWPMKIIIPRHADENIIKSFILNENVKIIKLNVQGLEKYTYNKRLKFLYDTGYFGPVQNNVLTYAVFVAIQAEYQEINIFGADMTIYRNIEVDQKNNRLMMKFSHFNQDDTYEFLMRNPEKIHPADMSGMMRGAARVFNSHRILNLYSKTKNIKIFNCSGYSMIDAYNRKS